LKLTLTFLANSVQVSSSCQSNRHCYPDGHTTRANRTHKGLQGISLGAEPFIDDIAMLAEMLEVLLHSSRSQEGRRPASWTADKLAEDQNPDDIIQPTQNLQLSLLQ